jgi:hypothetical protein
MLRPLMAIPVQTCCDFIILVELLLCKSLYKKIKSYKVLPEYEECTQNVLPVPKC